MVGAAGFEPTTPSPPVKCATRLRYAPTRGVYTRQRGSVQFPFASNNLCIPPEVTKTKYRCSSMVRWWMTKWLGINRLCQITRSSGQVAKSRDDSVEL